MWLKYFIGIFLFGQTFASLYDELLWRPDLSMCEGSFLPLNQDLQSLPPNQTIITTDDKSELSLGKEAILRDVTINQNRVKMFSENAQLKVNADNELQRINFLGLTSYHEDDFIVTAKQGNYKMSQDNLSLNDLNYRIGSKNNIAWGSSKKLDRDRDQTFTFEHVNVSFCPPSSPTWAMSTEKMVYYPEQKLVTLENPGLVLNGTELIKFPYFSFITSGRKSGFLQPTVNYTREYGFMYKQPYYFNLAANFDWVLAPIMFTKGSYGFNQLFRYLVPSGNGQFGSEVIWDNHEDDRRFQANWQHNYSPWDDASVDIDITRFSDSNWFRDFGNTFHVLDTLHPVEQLSLNQILGWGNINFNVAKFQNDFVTDSSTIPSSEVFALRPHWFKLSPSWGLSSVMEAGRYYNIQSSNQGAFGSSVHRVVGDIVLEQSINRPYGYLRNKFEEIIRYYNSDDVHTETSIIPSFSSEAGLFFEKRGNHLYQTLMPKLFYVYVPYRSQYDYPIIDASVKSDNNLSSLFSSRRFQGFDRIGDENAFVLSMSTMIKQAKATYELEMGKQINIESPKLCLDKDCDDDSHAYNPLILNLKGSQDNFLITANANYDTSLKSFRNVGANLEIKKILQSDWVIRYAYDIRQQDDASGGKTDYLSRLGIRQTWYATDFLTMNGAIVKDFKDDQFFSYEIGAHYDTCCWTSNINFGRRYIGISADNAESDDNYQWYASVELFLKGFSSKPIVKVGKDDSHEILESVDLDQ